MLREQFVYCDSITNWWRSNWSVFAEDSQQSRRGKHLEDHTLWSIARPCKFVAGSPGLPFHCFGWRHHRFWSIGLNLISAVFIWNTRFDHNRWSCWYPIICDVHMSAVDCHDCRQAEDSIQIGATTSWKSSLTGSTTSRPPYGMWKSIDIPGVSILFFFEILRFYQINKL